MGFDQLLGNARLKQNLVQAASKNRFSHFYMICGPEGSGKHTLAKLLSAALMCTESQQPCLRCNACRKVMAGTHPDITYVQDPEKKTTPVELIRSARADMYIQPNEGKGKIYIFPQELGVPGQNALLKVLEEPPSYGVFLLLTDNPEKILTTVRSRSIQLQLQSLPRDILEPALKSRFPDRDPEALEAAMAASFGYLGQAIALLQQPQDLPQTQAFVKSYLDRDPVALLQVLVPMEKWKRDQLLPVLEQWTQLFSQALLCRSGGAVTSQSARLLGAARSPSELLQVHRHLQKATQYAQGNVSCAAICGYLEWTLR